MFSFGHGTAPAERILQLLRGAGIDRLVDVRIAPGSRRDPQVLRGELEKWLPEHGISYLWDARLGGFRKPAEDSPDLALRDRAFRGYAGHMRTPEFATAVRESLLPGEATTTMLCSESLWWRCHRRLISDYLTLVHRVLVVHLMSDGRLIEHQPTQGVRVREDGLLIYDAASLASAAATSERKR